MEYLYTCYELWDACSSSRCWLTNKSETGTVVLLFQYNNTVPSCQQWYRNLYVVPVRYCVATMTVWFLRRRRARNDENNGWIRRQVPKGFNTVKGKVIHKWQWHCCGSHSRVHVLYGFLYAPFYSNCFEFEISPKAMCTSVRSMLVLLEPMYSVNAPTVLYCTTIYLE